MCDAHKQIRPLLGVKTAEPSASESDERTDSEEEREKNVNVKTRINRPRARFRHCGVGHFVLIAETPRPTVPQLMQMPPSMEPRAESRHVPLRCMPGID